MRFNRCVLLACTGILAWCAAARGGEVEDLMGKVGPKVGQWNTQRSRDDDDEYLGAPEILARDRAGIEARVEAYLALMQLGPKAKRAGPALVDVLADEKRQAEQRWVRATLAFIYLSDEAEYKKLLAAKIPGDDHHTERETASGMLATLKSLQENPAQGPGDIDLSALSILTDEKLLASKDDDERMGALNRLVYLEVVPRRVAIKVSGLLTSANKELRVAAMRVMLKAPGDMQAKSFEAMWKIGKEADEDPMVGNICDSALAAELGKKLTNPSEEVRLRAAQLLDFGEASNRPISPLLALAKAASTDKSEAVREAAESAWRAGLMEDFAGRHAAPPYGDEISIRGLQPEYVEPLKQHLADAKISDLFKERAAVMLLFAGELPDAGLPVLEKSSMRRGVVRFVAHGKNALARKALFVTLGAAKGAQRKVYLEDMRDPTEEHQAAMAVAIGGPKVGAMFVFDLINRRKLTCEREGALLGAVIKNLGNADSDIKQAAAEAAVSAATTWEAVPASDLDKLRKAVIAHAAKETEEDTKKLLIEALSHLPLDDNGGGDTTKALLACAGDPSPIVRAAAGNAVRTLIHDKKIKTEPWIEQAAVKLAASADGPEAEAGKLLWDEIKPGKPLPTTTTAPATTPATRPK